MSLNDSTSSASASPTWERAVLEELALATIREQRSRRRWTIFFRLVTLALLAAFVYFVWDAMRGSGDDSSSASPHAALIHIDGVIDADGEAGSERVVSALQTAFDDSGAKAVILRINSPGGSPVQAGIINDEIQRLRALHTEVPVYAVIEDVGASGAYYVAAAADRIFVNKASLVGSIGVIMEGFGATEALARLGIERRLITAGENKGLLDPFLPQRPEQVAHVKNMVDEIHQQFIAAVRQGRGDRLKETPETFSGLVWTGTRSIEMGLADDYGSVDSVAREVVQTTTLIDYTVQDGIAERFAKRIGLALGMGAARTLAQGTQLR